MNAFWGGLFVFWMLGSWMTHVIACIQASEWLFLIAGALFFPIAIIHGTGVWFGAW
jgi:hypothetical protein